jgi:predicted permease
VGEPERLHGAIVSANFFSLLGTPPELGRTFLPEEDVPGHDRVVVISHDLWVRRFGADPRTLGRTLPLDGKSYLVVGVMPAEFPVPTGMQLMATVPFGPRVDIWKPIAFSPQDLKAECCWDYCMLARLKPGVTNAQAQVQLDAIAASIAGRSRDLHYDLRTELIPIRKILSGETGQALPLILGAVGLLLAIACLNLANLLLARISTRRREFATRAALGAPRRRLVRQLLTESLVLASFGASAGLFLAHWGTRLLVSLGPADSPALQSGRINGPVLLFTLIAALVTGVAFGLAPAFESARRDLHENLQDGSRGMTSGRRAGRLRRALVTAEVALCTGLLLVASLLLHSFVKVLSVDKGFAVEKILTADLTLSAGQSPAVFYREILDRIRALPGVLSAGAVSALPLQHENGNTAVYLETDTKPSLDRPASLFRYVTPGYFAAMGIPLLAGRSFGDQEPAPVVAISAGLADRLWPGQPPSHVVGLRLRVGDVNARPATVVGVIGHVRTAGLEGKPLPTVYLPHAAFPSPAMSLVVRTAQEPQALARAVRSEVWKLNRNLPIPTMRTMREIVSAAVARRRFQMVLIALFAALSLALAVVGIYGVTSYSVAHRTREIGLRMALGASRAHVLQLVLAQGLRPVLGGLALGLVFAGSAAISLRSLLFGIGPLDPLALGAVSGTLLLAATLACYLPARRASSVDPATVLRLE